MEKMRAVARGSRVYLLNFDKVTLERVRFLSATPSTDHLAFGRDHRPDTMDQAARFLNDHRLVNRPYELTPAMLLSVSNEEERGSK